MALYTQLNNDEVQGIANDYSLGQVSSYIPLSGGSENSNYLVKSENGNFVITICEQKSVEEATQLANLLTHFNNNNYRTSKALLNSERKAISLYENKPIMVKDFLDGTVTEDIPSELMYQVGVELGKLHKVNVPDFIPNKTNYDKDQFNEVNDYAPKSPFKLWLNDTKEYVENHINVNAPKALIHSDIFPSNVIISKDKASVTIMDFEEAAYYYRMFDVGMTIIGSCRQNHEINLEKMSALLRGYKTEIELTDVEKQTLQAFTIYAGASMTFWRHKNFHYTNPDPDFFDHYKELQNVTDFVKGLQQNSFA
jgi:homoserine kinase type II